LKEKKDWDFNMKLIITESQYKILMEDLSDEGELYPINFDEIIGNSFEDKLKRVMNRFNKIKDKYLSIRIIGDLNLDYVYSDELYNFCNNLVMVDGSLSLFNRKNLKLPKLKFVSQNLDLCFTNFKTLPELEYVGGTLELYKSKIESLLQLNYVGGRLDLRGNPISMMTTEKELRKQINVGGVILL